MRDPKNTHKHIQIDGDHIKLKENGPYTSCLLRVVNSGTHIWRFKCNRIYGWSRADVIGITKCMRFEERNLQGFCDLNVVSVGFGFWADGTLASGNNCYSWGGIGWMRGDIIEMKVDFNTLELYYKVNEIDHGKAFDIDPGNYKATLTLYKKQSNYQLLSYQHIY